MMFFISVEYLL